MPINYHNNIIKLVIFIEILLNKEVNVKDLRICQNLVVELKELKVFIQSLPAKKETRFSILIDSNSKIICTHHLMRILGSVIPVFFLKDLMV